MYALRTLLVAGVMLAGTVSASTGAFAQTFAGSTLGCFGTGCLPGSGPTTDGKLSYSGSTFNVTAVNGGASIGATSGNVNNLGTFTLASTPGNQNFNGDVFNLAVTFTLPAGTSPNPGNYTANLTGSVQQSNGQTSINFATTSRSFAFSGGTFTLEVPSFVAVTPGNTIALSGNITARAVPGPIAGAGLIPLAGLGVAWFARRRKQKLAA